ncbi:MAG: hypothetical protein K8R88_10745 [Armatimonadetes bacterium]|nr:hypothetical protein [Armatimonadota bacterium]
MEAAREWASSFDPETFIGLRGTLIRLGTGEQCQVWVELATESELVVESQNSSAVEAGDVVVCEFYGTTYRGIVHGEIIRRNQRQFVIRPLSFAKITKAAEKARVRVCGFTVRVKNTVTLKTAAIENIGEEGICLVGQYHYETGESLSLQITSPFSTVLAMGKVMWSEQGTEQREWRHGVQLCFESNRDARNWNSTLASLVKI